MIVNINKINFFVKKNNHFWKKFKDHKWESINFEIYKYFLKKNTNYYDVGAWIGPTILIAASLFPNKIYGFEPDLKAYKELNNNIFLNKKKFKKNFIQLYNRAAYTKNCKIKLNIPWGKDGNSNSSLIKSQKISYSDITVKCINFLNFIKSKKIKTDDFIKIDIEGGEYKLLEFIGNFLRVKMPTVYVSPHPFLIDGFLNKIFQTNKLLFSLRGYKYIYQIKNNSITKSNLILLLLKYRLPILKRLKNSLIFTNKKIF
jgi:FkbM family methyltransferase